MSPARLISALGVAAALVAASAAWATPSAYGVHGAGTPAPHTHPAPVELNSPAVVYVETRARVEISLIEHNRLGKHIGLVQRRYTPVLATGSGFAVDPSGDLVTSGAVVNPNLDRAKIYAVNMLFHERYGQHAPVAADPFSRQTIADIPPDPRRGQVGDPINQRLQRCYVANTADPTGGCVIAASPEVRVFPYVSDQQRYGALAATIQPASAADVAVLKVGASSMPTVNLGTSSAGATAVAVLGFTQVPSVTHPMLRTPVYAHLSQPGSKIVPDREFAAVQPLLRSGYRGGPAVVETGQVVGFLSAPQPQAGESGGPATLVDAARIRAVLNAAHIDPRRGPTDTAFENAMHSFKNSEFAAAIPSLQNTLKLYPGHVAATEDLRVALAKKGTAADKTGGMPDMSMSSGERSGSWTTAAIAGVVAGVVLLGLAVAGALLLRRRRARPVDADPGASPGGHPASAQAAPPGPRHPAGSGGPGTGHGAAFIPGQPPVSPRTGTTPSTPARPSSVPAGAVPTDSAPPRARPRVRPGPGSEASPAGTGGPPGLPPQPPASPSAALSGSAVGSAPTFCTNCGRRRAADHRYCGWCGHGVG